MQDRLDKIDEKLDRIEDKISNIDVTLVKQAKDLEHHIYRTDLAEQNIEMLRKEIEPVKSHVSFVDATLKIIGILASIATFAMGVYKIFY
jgi:hypothetical protein